MKSWEKKAHKLIYELSKQAYIEANKCPRKSTRKHKAYSIPVIAEELVEALGNQDEEKAKTIFLDYGHLIQI